MGFFGLVLLGVVGAALIAGGVVAYRGTRRTGVRAGAAAAVAAGAAMLLALAVVIPASVSTATG